jgi:hypothetical protein
MIVKEVECGLKQPKPVRVTEMKRMMLAVQRSRGKYHREGEKPGCALAVEKVLILVSQRTLLPPFQHLHLSSLFIMIVINK